MLVFEEGPFRRAAAKKGLTENGGDRALLQEVLDILGTDIEDAPQFGTSVDTDFILGMGKIGDTVKILLDIDKVLAGDDFSGF